MFVRINMFIHVVPRKLDRKLSVRKVILLSKAKEQPSQAKEPRARVERGR